MKTKKVSMCFYKLILLAVMYRLSTSCGREFGAPKKSHSVIPERWTWRRVSFKKPIVCVTHEHVFDRACDSTKLSQIGFRTSVNRRRGS